MLVRIDTHVATASTFFAEILELHAIEERRPEDRYRDLYRLLQRVAKELTEPVNIQFPNLFARVRYLTDQHRMRAEERALLHDVRVKGRTLSRSKTGTVSEQEYLNGLKGVCDAVALFTGASIPPQIRAWLPRHVRRPVPEGLRGDTVPDIRVIVEELHPERQEVVCRAEEPAPGLPDVLTVRYGVAPVNEEFADSARLLWVGAHLYLMGIRRQPDGGFAPSFIVLEPDYLMNVTEIAECVQWKWENTDPRLHFISKFAPVESKPAMLLGNVANAFLDVLVAETAEAPVTFREEFKKAFTQYPFEFSTLFEGEAGNLQLKDFLQEAGEQFTNLRHQIKSTTVEHSFWQRKGECTLEPSFYSAKFGIQGRLDVLLAGAQQGQTQTHIIELKGGQFPKPFGNAVCQPWSNHAAQARLYRLLVSNISYLGGLQEGQIQPYILYSKSATGNLLPATSFAQEDRKLINLRNTIVALEYQWLQARQPDQMLALLGELDEAKMPGGLASFITEKFALFRKALNTASPLEQRYAAAWINFIAAEHYLNRVGEPEAEESGGRGLASLWRTSQAEKMAASDILMELTLQRQCYAGPSVTELQFTRPIPTQTEDGSTSFRVGDMCVLYPYTSEEENVLNHQLYKGTICSLTDRQVVVKLRQPQTGKRLFTEYQSWSLEGDSTDKAITDMYRNVGAFLRCPDTFRRNIILGLAAPRVSSLATLTPETVVAAQPALSQEQQALLQRMLSARDYFLLIGPPGTGKTNVMLRYLTRELFARPQEQILLLAYTNRAVDEICDALAGLDFIRIGTELGTEARHRAHLLDKQMSACDSREAVRARLTACRIYVGTLAAVQGKPLLFTLKKFTTAVIDEASQILEPQLLGLLPNVGRFLLIGDQKQLPAITVQPVERSRLPAPERLHDIGLRDRRVSFFERLLGCCKKQAWTQAWGQLTAQGRMHELLAKFPSHTFYENQLTLTGLDHQRGELSYLSTSAEHDPLEYLLSRQRLVYIPSYPATQQQRVGGGHRRHEQEATLIAQLTRAVQVMYEREGKVFDPLKSVGIITPYRNQVAMIRREMERAGVDRYQEITVDTVERFQGSQRDIILVSFCLHTPGQLQRLVSLMDEEDVDRKLNVLLTRARHQLVLVGAEAVMAQDRRYYRLVEFIKTRGGYLEEGVGEVLAGRCRWRPADPTQPLAGRVFSPDERLQAYFEQHIVTPLRQDKRTTSYPEYLLGYDADFNRNVLLNYGRADFDVPVLLPSGCLFSPADRVNVYCYYNMRKHFFSSLALFNSADSLLRRYYSNSSQPRISMLDFGCGPFTAGLALAHSTVLANNGGGTLPTPRVHYIGIDRSRVMLEKAGQLAAACPHAKQWTREFAESWRRLALTEVLSAPAHLVVLNFSYFFASDSLEPGELAEWVSSLIEQYPLHQYALIIQNTPVQHRNANYYAFRRLLRPTLQQMVSKTETVSYTNQEHSRYDKSETVFYELLATA